MILVTHEYGILKMPAATPTVSVRLPESTKTRLERIAKRMRRSRSSLMVEALDRHLDEIQEEYGIADTQGRFAEIMKFKGVGAAIAGPRSVEEIDASTCDFRGDE